MIKDLAGMYYKDMKPGYLDLTKSFFEGILTYLCSQGYTVSKGKVFKEDDN